MVRHEAACALVSGLSPLDDPTLGLADAALGGDVGLQGLLRVLPRTGAAVAGVTHDVRAETIGLFDGHGVLAAVGPIGVELLQADCHGHGVPPTAHARQHDVCNGASPSQNPS